MNRSALIVPLIAVLLTGCNSSSKHGADSASTTGHRDASATAYGAKADVVCRDPSSTIEPAQYLGNYPVGGWTGECTFNDRTITFMVTDWATSKDSNGRNIHSYRYDLGLACDPCGTSNNARLETGRVDDLYIISCEAASPCMPGTSFEKQRTKITLQRTH